MDGMDGMYFANRKDLSSPGKNIEPGTTYLNLNLEF